MLLRRGCSGRGSMESIVPFSGMFPAVGWMESMLMMAVVPVLALSEGRFTCYESVVSLQPDRQGPARECGVSRTTIIRALELPDVTKLYVTLDSWEKAKELANA